MIEISQSWLYVSIMVFGLLGTAVGYFYLKCQHYQQYSEALHTQLKNMLGVKIDTYKKEKHVGGFIKKKYDLEVGVRYTLTIHGVASAFSYDHAIEVINNSIVNEEVRKAAFKGVETAAAMATPDIIRGILTDKSRAVKIPLNKFVVTPAAKKTVAKAIIKTANKTNNNSLS